MPNSKKPTLSGSKPAPDAKSSAPNWQDLKKGPSKGQRQAKHPKAQRVPGKGSGR